MDSSSVNSIRMAKVMDNYQLLMNKLDQFIRKYYVNQLIRGTLYATGLILLLFILFNVAEYYYYFSVGVRKTLFYSFIGVSSASLIGWILIPMLKYFQLGKTISHDQAASIIGDHFPNVKDKLLNILQLKAQSTNSSDKALLMASINQKSEEIKPVPFKGAIDLKKNKQHFLRYALLPMLLFFILLFGAPSIFKEGSNRLINNSEVFERAAPFHFTVDKKDLTVVQFDDYPLTVKVDGEVLPNDVFIELDGYKYRLNKENANTFTYLFSNVQKDMKFNLSASTVNSETYDLNVLLKPNITGFDVKMDYPNYIGRTDETISNIGDFVVPMGTNLNWMFNSLNTDDISIQFSDRLEMVKANRNDETRYSYKKKALADQTYKLFVSNKDLPNADSIAYSISVIPDLHPNIKVEKFVDIRVPLPSPIKINPLSISLESGEISVPTEKISGQSPSFLSGGESSALQELNYYIWESNQIANYKETRNGLLGRDYSSKLSVHLSKGTISPKLIYAEVKKYENQVTKNKSTYWLVFELLWRDFFRFMAKKHGDKIFQIKGTRGVEPPQYFENRTLFDKWTAGQTGIPFIDANMRELNATGFMSNRGRQNVASFLINDMQLNWLWGAEYFESLLIDYDPCSNYGNWNYIAGVGSDPRENRYFNIPLQAKKYDPQGEYMRRWLPELEKAPLSFLFDPFKNRPATFNFDYPQPCIDFRKKSLS